MTAGLDPSAVALAFAHAINSHSVAEIARLMTDDHVFIDSLGTRIVGREGMRQGWAAYFAMVPDYTLAIDQTFSHGDTVVLLGTARGTYAPDGVLHSEHAWETPAAWRAVVDGTRIAEWRVYADNEPIRQAMSRQRS